MADLAGRLQIELRRTPGGLEAEILSSRPVTASRVFVGKGVEETAAGLPALFGICSTAQAAACAAAFEAARGQVASRRTALLRSLLVDAETVREHLWRVLLDWPLFLGAAPEGPAMARVMAAFGGLRAALSGGSGLMDPGAGDPELDLYAAAVCVSELSAVSADHLFGQPPGTWLGRTESARGLRDWAGETDSIAAHLLREVDAKGWAELGRSAVHPLPPLSAAELEHRLGGADADAFVAAPLWNGVPAESSPYSRNRQRPQVAAMAGECGNGLLPRLAAQLAELAALQEGLRIGLEALRSQGPLPVLDAGAGPSEGVGIARVQAARGLLVHRVALLGDRIADYRILAPTEWNFHPRGPVAAGLETMPDLGDGTLRRLAGLLVTAVDPCVDYAVTVR